MSFCRLFFCVHRIPYSRVFRTDEYYFSLQVLYQAATAKRRGIDVLQGLKPAALFPYFCIREETTMKYIKQYLRKEMKILEIGAGTGRYSLLLAEEGYRVDAVISSAIKREIISVPT